MVVKDIPYFNLEQIAESGQCFRWTKIDDNKYRIIAFGKCLEVIQEDTKVTFDCSEDEFEKIWYNYFDLNTDYGYILGMIDDADEFLKKASCSSSGIRILNQDLWEIIISFIISQNNNIPRIKKSIEAICMGIGKKISANIYGFPDFDSFFQTDKDIFNNEGLGYRADYIVELCEKYVPEMLFELPVNMNYEQAYKYYMTFKGIGKKVADCICLFGLHHLNACPIDTWMKKIIDEEYDGKMPDWMTGEYAGVYQQYAFYYKRQMNKTKYL